MDRVVIPTPNAPTSNTLTMGLSMTADVEVKRGLLGQLIDLCDKFDAMQAVPIDELRYLISEFDGSAR